MRLPVPDSVLYFENGRAAGDWLDCSVIGRIGGHSAPCVHISLQPVHLCLHAFKPVCSDQQVKGRIFGIYGPQYDRGELGGVARFMRSEEHTSELQSLMRIWYAVFCLKKKNNNRISKTITTKHVNNK